MNRYRHAAHGKVPVLQANLFVRGGAVEAFLKPVAGRRKNRMVSLVQLSRTVAGVREDGRIPGNLALWRRTRKFAFANSEHVPVSPTSPAECWDAGVSAVRYEPTRRMPAACTICRITSHREPIPVRGNRRQVNSVRYRGPTESLPAGFLTKAEAARCHG